ncbi:metaphase-anaphase transition protein (Mlo2) [Ceratobasidium sp. AG-Ba]|nr:metaphase-anaphase transition protein (Mlo2) [Ceratobasidium sp. AG-Ba]
MVQCISCEDWFHESCLNLRERVPPRTDSEVEMKNETEIKQESAMTRSVDPTPTPTSVDPPTSVVDPNPQSRTEQQDEDENESTASDPDIPQALITGDTYDALVCGQCVLKNATIRKYVGTPGARIVVPGPDGGWRVLGGEGDAEAVVDVGQEHTTDAGNAEAEKVGDMSRIGEGAEVGTKRRASTEAAQPTKRARPEPGSTSRCLAPPINLEAQQVLQDLERLNIKAEDGVKTEEGVKPGPGRTRRALGDVFLSDGWRERWCRCETCEPPLLLHPYLLHEEETYEPPQDPDAGLSLEELGMRALQSLPREHALDSIRAYNSMRDDLMLYLRPFAESGREVREEDITAFFASRRARA